ncbi:MAG: RodZ domain-containing protein [Acidimicrobiales bacterium]
MELTGVIWLVIVVLVVLVVVAIVWARVDAARSAHKSVETYERGIGALGQASKRTQSTGFRIIPHEEAGRPHVGRRIDQAGGEAPAERENVRLPGRGRLVPSRLPPAGEPKFRFSRPGRPPETASAGIPQAGDRAGEQERDDREAGAMRGALPATAPGAAAQARLAHARGRVPGTGGAGARGVAYQSPADRRRQVMTRRVATGATAGAAVVAIVVAAIFLSGGGGHHPRTSTTTTIGRGGGGRTTTTTTTTFPTTLEPTSVSPKNVAFTVPSGDYSLAFQATGGRCWVGIEHTSSGPWLFAETLGSGQSATYQGSGALVITLGAPAYVGFTVNGLVAKLPSGVTQPYKVELTPASG